MPDAVIALEYPAVIPIDEKGYATKKRVTLDVTTWLVAATRELYAESVAVALKMTAMIHTSVSDMLAVADAPSVYNIAVDAPRVVFAMTARAPASVSELFTVATQPTTVTAASESISTDYRIR